ncbi:MAG: UDP-N-acetylmuramoyl-L-alanine--D-glutamate ligase [Holosporales bacterium]
MSILSNLEGVTYGVVGLGKTGHATLKALRQAGARVVVFDDQCSLSDADFMHPDQMPWDQMTALVLSPGIPHDLPSPHPAATLAKHHKVPIITDIELFFQTRPKAKIVGITGTNGKSTTTALIAHVLREAGIPAVMGGNIGTPILSLEPLSEGGVYVLELSSYQLERAPSLSLDVAIFLNLSPDHLDRHGSMEGYCAAKERLFSNPKPGQIRIVGVDDPWSQQVYARQSHHGPQATLAISAEEVPVCLQDVARQNGALRGSHNAQNMVASYQALRALGLSDGVIARHMASFPGLPHRLEQVATCAGVQFINDSKATNGDAAARALQLFQSVFWIVGGRPKEGGLRDALPHLKDVQKAYLIGEAQQPFAAELGDRLPCALCGDLAAAVKAAFADAKASGHDAPVVLLAPACTSWDQYQSFEHRGDHFKAVVAEICAIERGAA